MKKLNREIVKYLSTKLNLNQGSIRNAITKLSNNYSQSTPNALAQIYAMSKGLTVRQKLDKEDKSSIPPTHITQKYINVDRSRRKQINKIKILINYDTTDYFKKGHIEEVNRAYTAGCYTATFILVRKIVENLIIDILKKQFPENNKINKELYFDTSKNRLKDFSVILDNLHKSKNSFGSGNQVVERLYQKSLILKNNTNDKTHSWFHLVKNSIEFNNLEIETIIELIKNLEKIVGLR